MLRILFLLLAAMGAVSARAQTLGGRTVFNFLRLPASPQVSASGGMNISRQTNDVSLALQNPALLRPETSGDLSVSFSSFYAGIKNLMALQSFSHKPSQTQIAAAVHYFSYGSIPHTDAAGNEMGIFRPRDYVMQVSVSRSYLEKWRYGISLKYIGSNYGIQRASGMAVDAGFLFLDTAAGVQIGFVASNMGTQLSTYNGEKEELPFDLKLGLSKKLKNAPLQFCLTLHHLQGFALRYEDPVFEPENPQRKSFFDDLFRHMVMSVQFVPADRIEITAGYNYLRRKELNIADSQNGLNGFSLGAGVLLIQFQLRYALSYYQSSKPYQQLGLSLPLRSFLTSPAI